MQLKIYVLGMLFLCSCSLNKFTANTTADMMEGASLTFNEEEDWDLARDAMPANLKMIEGLQKVSPENGKILTMLAQGYCSYAFAFLEEGTSRDIDRAKALYLRGYAYGLRALPERLRANAKGKLDEFEKEVHKIDRDEIPALFWGAYCLSSWINLNKSDIGAIAELARAEIMMKQVLAVREDFYQGGAHLFYGAYYGSRPRMLGGNPEKAKEHFEKAISISGGKFLLSKVYLAQIYAPAAIDEKLFEENLNEVLKAPDHVLPGEELANQVAKRRARILLKKKSELF